MNNTFLATKVSIMNEFKLFSDKIGANWIDTQDGFASDSRIGNSHLACSRPRWKVRLWRYLFSKRHKYVYLSLQKIKELI